MKKIVHAAVAAALLLGANAAQAQINFAPKVGLNVAKFKHTISDDGKAIGGKDIEYDTKIGASFGLMLNARFGNIALQPALTYSMKGAKFEYSVSDSSSTEKTTGSTSLGYFDVPINLVWTSGGDHGFQVFAGPYIGLGIGGKYESKEESSGGAITSTIERDEEVEFNGTPTQAEADKADDDSKHLVNGLDYGLNFGLGYLISNVQIQASYGLGLGNLAPEVEGSKASSRDVLKNRVISVTAAYIIGGGN